MMIKMYKLGLVELNEYPIMRKMIIDEGFPVEVVTSKIEEYVGREWYRVLTWIPPENGKEEYGLFSKFGANFWAAFVIAKKKYNDKLI